MNDISDVLKQLKKHERSIEETREQMAVLTQELETFVRNGHGTGDDVRDFLILRGVAPHKASGESEEQTLRQRIEPIVQQLAPDAPILIVERHITAAVNTGCVRSPASEIDYYHAGMLSGDALMFDPARGLLEFPVKNACYSSEEHPMRGLWAESLGVEYVTPGELFFLGLVSRAVAEQSFVLYSGTRDREEWEVHVGIAGIRAYRERLYDSRRDHLDVLCRKAFTLDVNLALEVMTPV